MRLDALLPRPRVAFIPAAPYARALTWLEQGGHRREQLLAESGIEAEQMAHQDALLTLDQVEAFVLLTAKAMEDPTGALDFGSGMLFPSHGAVGFAGLTAPNILGGLKVMERYLELVTPLFVVEWRDEGSRTEVELLPRYRMDPVVLRIHMRVVLSSLYVLVRHGVGSALEGIEVDLPVRDHALVSWMRAQRIVVRTELETITLRFPSRAMRAPFLLADEQAHALALARCDELMAARRTEERTIHEVRQALRRAGPPFLDLDAVSRQLGVSQRTLRRHLEREGATFRQLLDEARFTAAARALAHSDRSISAIAYDLGYSTPANFTRAFGRALGMSPSAYRDAELARAEPRGSEG